MKLEKLSLGKASFYSIGIWSIPILFVIAQSILFIPISSIKSINLPYYIIFWGLRALLSPLIVLFVMHFWVEHKKIIKLLITHLAGFISFSLLFWGIGFVALRNFLQDNHMFGITQQSSQRQIFETIADNSSSINVVVYVSTVAFCYIWEFIRRNTEINQKAAELEKSLLISKLEALRGQLNTHFLFNTLNTISSFVLQHRVEEANSMLVNLSNLLRYALRENKDQLIVIRKEIEILNIYLDIQKIRFKKRLKVNIQYDNKISDALIPSFLLQPLVENSIKYAIEPFKEQGLLNIKLMENKNKLSISVNDNGKTPFENINFNSGIGLNNTKERLKQLYDTDFTFEILPNFKDEGINVQIEIPIQYSSPWQN